MRDDMKGRVSVREKESNRCLSSSPGVIVQ